MTEQKIIPERVVLLISIAQRGKGQLLIDQLTKRGIGYQLMLSGKGTAPTEMMDIFGLGSREKDIVLSFGKESAAERIIDDLTDTLSSQRNANGIMLSVSLSAVGNVIATILTMKKSSSDSTSKNNTEADNMKSEHKHSLILIAVNQGYTDSVMQAARSCGATGGTVVRARLAEDELSETFRGIAFQSEKEILAILAPDSIKENLMDSVNRDFGVLTEAQGVVCAIPVNKAFKI